MSCRPSSSFAGIWQPFLQSTLLPSLRKPVKHDADELSLRHRPVKKKGGTAAGVPRSVGEAQSSAASGAAKDQVRALSCDVSLFIKSIPNFPSISLPSPWRGMEP